SDLILLHGTILQDQGNFEEAEVCFMSLWQDSITSDNAPHQTLIARHYIAMTYRERGRLAEAIHQWQNLLADAPDYLPAWVGLAEVYLVGGDLAGCQDIAERLSWRPEWLSEATVLRARLYLARNEYSAAREILEKVLVDQPGNERTTLLLSQALLQEGKDWAAAEKMLRKTVQLNPRNAE